MMKSGAELRNIAIEQYNAEKFVNTNDEKVYYRVEVKNLYAFGTRPYFWKNSEDAVRYCNEQVKAGLPARVISQQYIKAENTVYTKVVYKR